MCPKSYQHYYVNKLREKSASAFLALGTAIDESLNTLLADYKLHACVTVDYKQVFDNNWDTVRINNEVYPLADCTLVGYAKEDFVPELLQDSDNLFINAKIAELTPAYVNQPIPVLKEFLDERRANKAHEQFFEEEHKVLNIMNYLSLRRKAHLMLDAYVRDIIPQIEEVKEIQLQIELESDNGETVIGYVDTVVKFKGDTEYCVLDNKTSASPYKEDKVKHSEQLSIYTFALGLKRAAYAVMWKSISLNKEKTCIKCGFKTESSHKTCNNEIDGDRCKGEWTEVVKPEAKTQLIIDDVSEQTQHVVIENIADVSMAIDANIFPKNFDKCANYYGSPCVYRKMCWSGSDDTLVKVEKK